MASDKKTWIFFLFSPIPREQRGHRFDWKELISFLEIYVFLCITQISFQDAKLLDSVIIVVFNKLELLLQWKQCGRWDKSLFSLWGFSSDVSEPQFWHFLPSLTVPICCSGSSENADFLGWIQSLGIQTQFSALLSNEGMEKGEGQAMSSQQLCSLSSMWSRGTCLLPNTTMKVTFKGCQTGWEKARREIKLLWGSLSRWKEWAAKGRQAAVVCNQGEQVGKAGAPRARAMEWKRAGSRGLGAWSRLGITCI